MRYDQSGRQALRQRQSVKGAAAPATPMRGTGSAFPRRGAAARQNLRPLTTAAGIELRNGALEKGSWMRPAEMVRNVTGGLG